MPPFPKAPFYTHLMRRDQAQLEQSSEQVVLKLSSQVEKILGASGKLLAYSKSSYSRAHPDHQVFYNACIFDAASEEQLWFGDVDMTKQEAHLQKVANSLGRDIILTAEYPFRFEGLETGLNIEDDMARSYKDYQKRYKIYQPLTAD